VEMDAFRKHGQTRLTSPVGEPLLFHWSYRANVSTGMNGSLGAPFSVRSVVFYFSCPKDPFLSSGHQQINLLLNDVIADLSTSIRESARNKPGSSLSPPSVISRFNDWNWA
jgi:hypothetical protein